MFELAVLRIEYYGEPRNWLRKRRIRCNGYVRRTTKITTVKINLNEDC